jgi:hypothetical protein
MLYDTAPLLGGRARVMRGLPWTTASICSWRLRTHIGPREFVHGRVPHATSDAPPGLSCHWHRNNRRAELRSTRPRAPGRLVGLLTARALTWRERSPTRDPQDEARGICAATG